jgi:hypothetical protein
LTIVEELKRLRTDLDGNTRLTAVAAAHALEARAHAEAAKSSTDKLRDDFEALRSKVAPVTDAVETMSAGIRTIGRIGDAAAKVAKVALVLGAAFAAAKLLFSGHTWSEVNEGFFNAMGMKR